MAALQNIGDVEEIVTPDWMRLGSPEARNRESGRAGNFPTAVNPKIRAVPPSRNPNCASKHEHTSGSMTKGKRTSLVFSLLGVTSLRLLVAATRSAGARWCWRPSCRRRAWRKGKHLSPASERARARTRARTRSDPLIRHPSRKGLLITAYPAATPPSSTPSAFVAMGRYCLALSDHDFYTVLCLRLGGSFLLGGRWCGGGDMACPTI